MEPANRPGVAHMIIVINSSMKLLIVTCTLFLASPVLSQTPGTRVTDVIGGKYISGNKIVGQPPVGYEKFLILWVDDPGICRKDLNVLRKENFIPDKTGRISICGRVVFQGKNFPNGSGVADGNYLSYEFKEAYLVDLKGIPVSLRLITQTVDGVHYRFSGTYIEPTNDADDIQLEGTMAKLVNGKAVSETTLRFSPFHYLE